MLSKRGNTKLFVSIFLVIIALAGIFAATELSNETQPISEEQTAIEQKVTEVSSSSAIAEATLNYVKDFVQKRNILPEKINSIRKIDFNSLPKEVNIENVNDNNLAIYEVNYNETAEENSSKNIFVITYSVETLQRQGDLIVASDKRQILNFGFDGEASDSIFLNTATGVPSSIEQGYVMVREGSITAMSTNLEVLEGSGEIKIIVVKNGEQINFGNILEADSMGVKIDYDVQSKGVINFVPGDVISVYLEGNGIKYKNVITMVEITTTN